MRYFETKHFPIDLQVTRTERTTTEIQPWNLMCRGNKKQNKLIIDLFSYIVYFIFICS